MNAAPAANVVLVHGGFADGSGWRAVYDLLTEAPGRKTSTIRCLLGLAAPSAGKHLPSSRRTARISAAGRRWPGASRVP